MDKTSRNPQNENSIHSKYIPGLCLCFVLFVFRVTSQFIQKFYNLPFLPPFNAWYSGALAYPWLLAAQVLIIALMIYIILGFKQNRIRPKYRLGFCLLILGSIYFIVMLLRLISGFTFASDHYWLGAHIPAFFHIVLASFVLLLGHFNYKYGKLADER